MLSTAPRRVYLSALFVFILGVISACSGLNGAPEDPSSHVGATPTDDPLEMANAYSVSKAGDALLVWERDSLVLEHYTGGFEADERHLLASGTKTFSGVMALAAADDGWLSLDERVAASIPSWAEDPQKSTVTIRQLLHLTSGIETGIGRAPRFEEALQTPLVHAPGEGFRYGPVAFQVFGAVLASNLADLSPEDYLYRRILEPIGAKAPEWFRTGGDVNLGAGARMTARDWLRFGRLLLGDGTFEGNVIITPGLLNALTTPTEAGPGYGLSVWLNAPVDPNSDFFDHVPPDVTADGPDGMIYNDGPTDLFMAAGLNNQRLFVIPSREMVVVRFGRRDRTWNDAEFLARLLNGDAYEASDENHASRMSLHATSRLVNRQMSVLDSTLSLTQSQRDAIRPIIQRRVVHLLEMRQQRESEEPLRRREKRQMLRSLRQLVRETDAAIRSHLTPQQQAAYEELREEQKQTLRMQRQR